MRRFHLILIAVALISLNSPSLAWAHGEQIGAGEGPRGPVTLTVAQIKALGLQTAAAEVRPIESVLGVNGELAPLPDAQADVTLRISGTVKAVYANLSDAVRKGDKLALVESRVVGNPPPTVLIVAPISGTVDGRNASVGQSVEPNSVLFHVSDLSRMRVVGRVYEEDLGKVRIGQAARIKVMAYPGEKFSGTVSFIGPTLDPDTRTVEIAVTLENSRGLLKPNLFARVDVIVAQNQSALTVPTGAILEASGEKFVFVRQGNRFDRVDVEVGVTDGKFVEIRSGLVPGDEVVTVGVRQVYTQWLAGGSAPKAEGKD